MGLVGAPEGMKTSESYSNLQQISPETTGTLGAGTMSSRSRPVTGVVLLEEVQESGKKDAPTVAAELVLDGGVAATATFQSEYPLVRGMFYDVEVKNAKGDGAFLQVARLPDGKTWPTSATPSSRRRSSRPRAASARTAPRPTSRC